MAESNPQQEITPRLRTLIVDDEPLARARIRGILQKDPDVQVIGDCPDGQSAIEAIHQQSPDLVFLDIQMPECDGFDVLKTVGPDRMGMVIFVSAFDKHALRAFEFHALDYLLKPFTPDRFRDALQRAKTKIRTDPGGTFKLQLRSLLGDVHSQPSYIKRLIVKTGGRVVFLKTDDIEWIEAAGNYVTLHIGSSSHLIRQTMNEVESRLDPERFLRIHRSTIVKFESVREMQPLFHGDYAVILNNGTRLTLSRNYKDRIPGGLIGSL